MNAVAPHWPPELELEPPAEPALADLVELWRVTSLTPSIRRRRLSVRATSAWLVAHPCKVIWGTLPGGVAEATAAAEPAPVALLPAGAAAVADDPLLDEELLLDPGPEVVPLTIEENST